MNDALRLELIEFARHAGNTLVMVAQALHEEGEEEALAARISAAGQEAKRAADELERGETT